MERREKPILQGEVLKPLQFQLPPNHRILQAKIFKQTRAVIDLTLDQSRSDDGILDVSFKVLEHNDGCIIQLICQGDSETTISADGIILGQGSVTHVVYRTNSKTVDVGYQINKDRTRHRLWGLIAFLVGSLSFLCIGYGVDFVVRGRHIPHWMFDILIVILVVAGLSGLLGLAYMIFFSLPYLGGPVLPLDFN